MYIFFLHKNQPVSLFNLKNFICAGEFNSFFVIVSVPLLEHWPIQSGCFDFRMCSLVTWIFTVKMPGCQCLLVSTHTNVTCHP